MSKSTPPSDTETRGLVTTADTCERLGKSRWALRQMVNDGEIVVAQRLPGRTGAYLFDPAEVDRVAAVIAADLEERLARLQPATQDGGTAA